MAVPPESRDPVWWMREHSIAESNVTIAAKTLALVKDERLRSWASHQLDARLDHLEIVDDTCDAILCEVRAREPAWVADAMESHFYRGESWRQVAERIGLTTSAVSHATMKALVRCKKTPKWKFTSRA